MGLKTDQVIKACKHVELRRVGGDFNEEKVNFHVDEDQIKVC